MSRNLPFYVERGGEIVIRQPLSLRDTTSYGFVIPAQKERLSALADRLLNDPTGGAVKYVPAGPFVMLVCTDIARGQAQAEPDRSKGWMPEKDVAFWVPLLRGKQVGPLFVPERLVWFLPYVFVDNAAATVTGREIFGFPKEQAEITFPADPSTPGSFWVNTLVIESFSAESQAKVARLLEVNQANQGPPLNARGLWTDTEAGLREFVGKIAENFLDEAEDALMPAASVALHLLQGWLEPQMWLVFLKQFRDVVDPSRACYQAIVEAPATVQSWHSAGWLPPHRITIAKAESHPIVEDLGLSGHTVESELGMWFKYDFTMEAGSIVWSASLDGAGASREE